MIKKTLAFFSILILGFFLIFNMYVQREKEIEKPLLSPISKAIVAPFKQKREEKSIFVPYWALNNYDSFQGFDRVIYFGISPDNEGINKNDKGYKNIENFINKSESKNNFFVTIRMVDHDINSNVLRNQKLQNNIIEDSIKTAKEHNLKGIVLDFEFSVLAFESVKKEINSFFKVFYDTSKKEKLEFYITLYGDTFFRLRPYDVATLSKTSDKIMVMAYDFHKAKGNPGPNFPLFGKNKFGYDFSFMLSDFLKTIPPEKIEVIFGLFGYDWEIDNNGNSINQASALSYLEIKKKFLDNCDFTSCKIQRDKDSSETKISYIDENGKSHVIWFEDMESVNKKTEFLKQNGINKISFWAYSYF